MVLTTRARVVLAEGSGPDGEVATQAIWSNPASRSRLQSLGEARHNVGLLAAMIAHEGEATTQAWLTGLKANLARKPQGNDRAQAKAIYERV